MSKNKGARKSKRSSEAVKTENDILEQCMEFLSQTELQNYNTKKLFEISFLVEITQCDKALQKVVKTGKEYEALSFTAFITYQDVLELIGKISDEPENVDLPSSIKECSQEVAKLAKKQLQDNELLLTNILALIVKLKIIHVMYSSRIREVKRQDKRNQLDAELEALLVVVEKEKKGKGKKNKKGKKGKKDKKHKSKEKLATKQPSTTVTVAYKRPSEVILEKDDLVLDENIYNEIFFYVLVGFGDMLDLCKNLIQINVPISAIIKTSCSSSSIMDERGLQLDGIFDTPSNYKHLENTAVMVFSLPDAKDSKIILEELLYVIKKICFFKRQQLSYIRSLNIFNFGATPKLIWTQCLERYHFIMAEYPPECVNIPIIVTALVEQVVWAENGAISDSTIIETYTSSDRTSETNSCICPFGFEAFQGKATEYADDTYTRNDTTFQVHEEDFLKTIANYYKQIGMKIYDATLKNLVLMKPYEWIHKYRWFNSDQDLLHEEQAFLPEDQKVVISEADREIEEIADIVHLALFSRINRRAFQFKDYSEIYDLIKDLDYYDENLVFRTAQPYADRACCRCEPELNDVIVTNHWKEELSQAVLLQKLFKSSIEFAVFDQFYCQETDSNLLKFHDNLDNFGMDTIIWNQSLRTPICLRDFCRYAVLESHDWFVVHKLREHLGSSLEYLKMTEECAGLTQILNSGEYEEYNFLWKQKKISNPVPPEENCENRDAILSELITYPNSEHLVQYYNNTVNDGGGNRNFMAYDLGTSQVQLTGSTTIFHSYDGVKITVDTARFLNDPPRCCVKLCSDENTLIFHSNDLTTFHMILADQTIIVFTKTPSKPKKILQSQMRDDSSKSHSTLKKSQDKSEAKEIEISVAEHSEHQEEGKPNVSGRFVEKVSDIELKIQFGYQHFDKLLKHLKEALRNNTPIKKVSVRRANRSIKRKNSTIDIPLSGFLTRVLPGSFEKVYKIKGYHPTIHHSSKKKTVNPWPSFNKLWITLPNGLSIESLPLNGSLMEIKQAYKYADHDGGEEYRVFCTFGSLLVRKLDGTFKILRSNGDQIDLLDEIIWHKKNKTDRMEEIFNILKTLDGNHSNRPSRGEYLNVKVTNNDLLNLYEFGDVPYTKKIILTYDGKEIVESKGKLIERQIYYLVNEDDHLTEERYFERDDGLKASFDRNGRHIISFPDGTKISKWYEVEKDLIVVDSKSGGWVSVIMTYKYQHPDYVTVLYEGIKRKAELYLEDGTTVKQVDNNFTVDFNSSSKVEVLGTVVTFQKNCDKCLCTFDARIDTDPCPCRIDCPMGENEEEGAFLEVCDSYNKRLSSDYRGNCKMKPEWITGELNKQNCNHFQTCRKRQNLYVLHRQRPNAIFWNNFRVSEKQTCCDAGRPDCKLLNYYNEITNKQNLEFFTTINRDFKKKYTLLSSAQSEVQLSKYSHNKNVMFYVTYRILQQIFDVKNFKAVAKKLRHLKKRENNFIDLSLMEGVAAVMEYFEKIEEELSRVPDPEPTPESIESSVEIVDFFTVNELVEQWRTLRDKYFNLISKRDFPCYFESEYFMETFNGVL